MWIKLLTYNMTLRLSKKLSIPWSIHFNYIYNYVLDRHFPTKATYRKVHYSVSADAAEQVENKDNV